MYNAPTFGVLRHPLLSAETFYYERNHYQTCDLVSYIYTMCFRYVVLLSGKKAIHEALVVRTIDFADRPDLHADLLMNANAKGYFLIN